MHRFFITIKNDGKVIGNLDKIAINLDTSRDIVSQADAIASSLLGSCGVKKENRNNISWKTYQFKENKFMMVSKTKNWI